MFLFYLQLSWFLFLLECTGRMLWYSLNIVIIIVDIDIVITTDLILFCINRSWWLLFRWKNWTISILSRYLIFINISTYFILFINKTICWFSYIFFLIVTNTVICSLISLFDSLIMSDICSFNYLLFLKLSIIFYFIFIYFLHWWPLSVYLYDILFVFLISIVSIIVCYI